MKQLKDEIRDAAQSDQSGQFDPELRIEVYETDVTSTAEVKAMVGEALQAFGRMDIVICNAGYMDPWVPIADHDPETWWTTYVSDQTFSFMERNSQKTIGSQHQ